MVGWKLEEILNKQGGGMEIRENSLHDGNSGPKIAAVVVISFPEWPSVTTRPHSQQFTFPGCFSPTFS